MRKGNFSVYEQLASNSQIARVGRDEEKGRICGIVLRGNAGEGVFEGAMQDAAGCAVGGEGEADLGGGVLPFFSSFQHLHHVLLMK